MPRRTRSKAERRRLQRELEERIEEVRELQGQLRAEWRRRDSKPAKPGAGAETPE